MSVHLNDTVSKYLKMITLGFLFDKMLERAEIKCKSMKTLSDI